VPRLITWIVIGNGPGIDTLKAVNGPCTVVGSNPGAETVILAISLMCSTFSLPGLRLTVKVTRVP
jgi:hypothetical protein